ncbi:hypothetical protein [Bradyrhizobium sp. STM 3809]|uniref:hypothetical protein n=1 Tax=Bradyrhizobium sp. STM 3809 TaxID=551936 RepID=UPI0002D5ADA4|nr:hypothetical protein [Bradyrhizobium sp. STM 3809]
MTASISSIRFLVETGQSEMRITASVRPSLWEGNWRIVQTQAHLNDHDFAE